MYVYICHSCSGDQRCLNQPLHLSVGTNKAWWSLLSGTPIFVELRTFSWWPLKQVRVLKTKVWLLNGSQSGKTVNSTLGLLFIEFSWQTWCEDAPEYPVLSEIWNLVALELWPGNPLPLMHSSSYTPSKLKSLMSYTTAYVTNMSPCGVPLTSFSILVVNLCTCALTLEQKILTQSVSTSASTLKLSLWSQRSWLQVHTMTIPPGPSAQFIIKIQI